MGDKFVQLPNDAANTGKKVRTNDRVVGSDTVHEHFNILQDRISDVQADVLRIHPSGNEGGLLIRPIFSGALPGVATVTGSIRLSEAVTLAGGSVNVGNFPANQNVTQGTTPWIVSGSAWTPTITGSLKLTEPIAVSNFPAVQPVSDNGGSLTVDGTVGVSNFPANQNVTQGTTPWIISGSAWTPTVTGSLKLSEPIAVSNFPANQSVTQGTNPWIISGSAWTPTITGSVSLSEPVVVSNIVGVSGSNVFVSRKIPVSVLSGTFTGSVSPGIVFAPARTRHGFSIYNDSPAVMYVKLGDSLLSNNFSFKIFPDGLYESEYNYTGPIVAFWLSATGSSYFHEYI